MSDRERRRRPIAREPVARPRIEVAVFYRLPRITGERQQEMYIVQGEEAQPEYLVRDEKVADVGSADLVQAAQSHSGSSGRGSVRYSVRLMFRRPSRVKAAPFRPIRVGATQSNRSTPRRIASIKSSGNPTPIR